MKILLLGLVVMGLLGGCATREVYVRPAVPVVQEQYVYPVSSPAKFAVLPSAVQHTIAAQAGAGEITDINKSPVPDAMFMKLNFGTPVLIRPFTSRKMEPWLKSFRERGRSARCAGRRRRRWRRGCKPALSGSKSIGATSAECRRGGRSAEKTHSL